MAKRINSRVLAKMQGRMDPYVKRLIFLSVGAILTISAVLVIHDIRRPLRHKTLHLAAAALDVQDVRHHLRHHADVNECDSKGIRPLMWAIVGKPSEPESTGVSLSIEQEKKELEAWRAARQKQWHSRQAVMLRLIHAGADVNAKEREHGATCLHIAAEMGDGDAIRLLVAQGAKVDEPADDGVTALFAAAASNGPEAAVALLEAGAKVNAEAKDGTTPLDNAYEPAVIDVLRRYGGIRSQTD